MLHPTPRILRAAESARLSALARGAVLPLLAWCAGCSSSEPAPGAAWSVVVESPSAALMAVSGTAADDVWMVGAEAADGPLVLHWNGAEWAARRTGAEADLWWVHPMEDGSAFMAGSKGTVLRYRDDAFTALDTPQTTAHVVFGVWAASDEDVYAVGAVDGADGFIWHYDGTSFSELPLPADLPSSAALGAPALFKVWGSSGADVWVVGDAGVVLRGNAELGFRALASGSDERLFTVHGRGDEVVMVGGSANGLALELEGEELVAATPPGAGPLQGVSVSEQGVVWAVGVGGNAFERRAGDWQQIPLARPVQSLHSVWIDPGGGVWAVGGNVLTERLDGGVALHYAAGGRIPRFELGNSTP